MVVEEEEDLATAAAVDWGIPRGHFRWAIFEVLRDHPEGIAVTDIFRALEADNVRRGSDVSVSLSTLRNIFTSSKLRQRHRWIAVAVQRGQGRPATLYSLSEAARRGGCAALSADAAPPATAATPSAVAAAGALRGGEGGAQERIAPASASPRLPPSPPVVAAPATASATPWTPPVCRQRRESDAVIPDSDGGARNGSAAASEGVAGREGAGEGGDASSLPPGFHADSLDASDGGAAEEGGGRPWLD